MSNIKKLDWHWRQGTRVPANAMYWEDDTLMYWEDDTVMIWDI